jgi:hypothetical protein
MMDDDEYGAICGMTGRGTEANTEVHNINT